LRAKTGPRDLILGSEATRLGADRGRRAAPIRRPRPRQGWPKEERIEMRDDEGRAP